MKYDESRQMDIAKMNSKLLDPEVSSREKAKAHQALYAIRNQAQFKSIAKLREDITRAHMNHDTAQIERLTREAQKIDRDYSN